MVTKTKTNGKGLRPVPDFVRVERGEIDAEGAPAGPARAAIVIPRPQTASLKVRIVGDSTLVCHNFGAKARREISEKQARAPGAPVPKKGERNPTLEYEQSFYRDVHGIACIPAAAVREAMASAYLLLGDGWKRDIYTSVWIEPRLIPILGGDPTMREDIVRLSGANRPADLRYRAGFDAWYADLTIHFDLARMNAQSAIYLLESAGLYVGILEGRREKGGEWGSFHVQSEMERA